MTNMGNHMMNLCWLESFWQDLYFAFRMFAKNAGTSIIAVISLAIAIGPNCALFSVVDRVILRPPQVYNLHHLYFMDVRTDRPGKLQLTSYPDLQEYRTQAGDVASFAATFDQQGAVLNSAGNRQVVPMQIVSENYFSVLGARAVAGRALQQGDTDFQGEPPAVISYSLWQRYLKGSNDVVGRTLYVSGQAYSLVGVMPRGFHGPGIDLLPIDVWIPFSACPPGVRQSYMQRGHLFINPLLSLRDGVSKAQAEAVLAVVARRLASEYPDNYKGRDVILRDSENTGMLGEIVLSLAGLVILIACANISGILMAQSEARRQEFALRVALGASRVRLVRELITENLLISLAAGCIGLTAALWLMRALPVFQPLWFLTLNFDLHLDARLLVYTLAITLLTALAAGLLPSLRASRPDLVATLKGDAPTGRSRFRFRGALVIAQIAISQFLLVGAALLFRSYQEAQQARPGFDPGKKVLAAFLTSPAKDKPVDFIRLADRLRSVPGVVRVSFIDFLPLSGMGEGKRRAEIPGLSLESAEVGGRRVGAGYFAVTGTRLMRGRDFAQRDSEGAAVVNETMAHQFWSSPDAAMGKVVRIDNVDYSIIGVAENGKYESLEEPPMPFLFIGTPLRKADHGTLLIETAAQPSLMAEAVRKRIDETDPNTVVASLGSLRQSMQLLLLPYRLGAGLIGTMAILAVFLASVGLYGAVAYSTARRTHEIGIRVAVGARPAQVLALVFREILSRIAIGTVIGIALALAGAEVLKSALYGVSPADPIGIASAMAVTVVVASIAVYVPGRRALRVTPMDALREQ